MGELNIGAVVGRVIALLSNIHFLARATGTWLAILIATDIAVILAQFAAAQRPSPGLVAILNFVRAPVHTVAIAACAVNVHRSILLNDQPRLRVSRIEWGYILRGLRVWLPVLGIAIPIILTLAFVPMFRNFLSKPPGQIMIGVIFAVIVGPLLVPRSLSLPALAIGRRDFIPPTGSSAATGQRHAIYACTLIVGALPALVVFAINRLLLAIAPFAAYTVLNTVLSLFQAVLWASLLSFLYAGVVEQRRELLR